MRGGRTLLFTDGSFKRGRMGVGFLALDGARMVDGCLPVPGAADSNRAELHALDHGVRAAVRAFPGSRAIDVLTDSDSTVRAVRGWSEPDPEAAALLAGLRAFLDDAGVGLAMHWTPGHVDESTPYGLANAAADRLAVHGQYGHRLLRSVPYGPSWAQDLSRAHGCLRGLPAQVGPATAAAWLGIGREFLVPLLERGFLARGTRPGLIDAESVWRVRAQATAEGRPMPDLSDWTIGPIEPPRPMAEAVLAVAAGRSGPRAGAGGVLRFGGRVVEAARPVAGRPCPVATDVAGIGRILAELGSLLPPLSTVRVLVADPGLYRVAARLEEAPSRAARHALGRLSALAHNQVRARLVVELADEGTAGLVARARDLADRASRGASLRREGVPQAPRPPVGEPAGPAPGPR